jgi:membrane-bound lytic murein transglycosylase B
MAAIAAGGGISAGGGGHSNGGGIPAGYKAAYVHAAQATCLGGNWEILAGIGKVESSQGQNMGPSSAGAIGPMQFEPATFAAVRHRHPDVGGNVYSIHDAALAAAHKLCDDGADRGDIPSAIFAYNHSQAYVANVQNAASGYRN